LSIGLRKKRFDTAGTEEEHREHKEHRQVVPVPQGKKAYPSLDALGVKSRP
jgi:hypothetical protein